MGLSDGSRMSREIHVRILERLRGKFPWSTHLGGLTGAIAAAFVATLRGVVSGLPSWRR